MKHIPILFSTAMVQAILDGQKTQTRRVVKWPKAPAWHDLNYGANRVVRSMDGYWQPEFMHTCSIGENSQTGLVKCPYGQPGDVLWVRETWAKNKIPTGWPYHYMTDDNLPEVMTWKPSIHMPKAACRLWLKVTNVRVERLQDISEDDAKAEGIVVQPESEGRTYDGKSFAYCAFRVIWMKINGVESWNTNPWVWVIEFEPCEMPADFLP